MDRIIQSIGAKVCGSSRFIGLLNPAPAWTGFSLLALAVILRMYQSAEELLAFSHSDFQYLPVFFDDLFRRGGRLSDWAIPHSPYFFPDLFLHALLQLGSSQADWLRLSTAVIQIGVFGWLLWRISVEAGATAQGIGTLAALAGILLVFKPGGLDFPTSLFCASDHGGQAMVGLLSYYLLLRPGAWRVLAVQLLAVLTCASDPLYFITSAGGLAFLCLRTQTGATKVWGVFGLFVACFIGAWLRYLLPIPPPQPVIVWGRSVDALSIFSRHISEGPAWIAYSGLGLGVLSVWLTRTPQQRNLAIFAWLTVASTLIGLAIIGAEVVTWKSRYFVSLWLALVLLAGGALRPILSWKRLQLIASFALLIVGLWNFILQLPNIRNLGRLKPEPAACFDRASSETELNRCVATYWKAKTVAALAARPPLLSQIRPDGWPDWWITTRRTNQIEAPVDCAILANHETGTFVNHFGQPSRVVTCGETQVLIYAGAQRDSLNRLLLPRLHTEVDRRR